MPSICMVANRDISPLFIEIGFLLEKKGYEVRFLAADEYAYQLIQQNGFQVIKRPPQRRLWYRPQMHRFEAMCKMDIGFTALGIKSVKYWTHYFCKRADFFKSWLDASWSVIESDAVFIFNGVQHFEQLAAEKFRNEGKKTIFFENGLFPKTAQLDPMGTNAFAEIKTIPNDEFAAGVSSEELAVFIERLKEEYTELKEEPSSSLLLDYRLHSFRWVWFIIRFIGLDLPFLMGEYASKLPFFIQTKRSYKQEKGADYSSELPERYIFFPLQVSSDSQLLVHADRSIESAIRMAYQATSLMDPRCSLVVKEHPLERRSDYAKLRLELPGICWIKDVPLQEIIERSLCVVNINSSVGLQALIFDKPVICLGQSLYGRDGISLTCLSSKELDAGLKVASSSAVKKDLIYRFLYHLRFYYSVEYDRGALSHRQLDGITAALDDLVTS